MAAVLVTEGFLRKSLAMTRSLGARGVEVWTADRMRFTPSALSKYSRRTLVHPDPAAQPQEYAAWLLQTLRSQKFDALFPSDDATLHAVMAHREEVERLTNCVLPPSKSYEQAADKYLSMKWAMQAGVPCPRTVLPCDESDVEKAALELPSPIVIKPRKSSGSRGIRIVNDSQSLREQYREIAAQYPQPMLQEYIPTGERYDVCLLYNRQSRVRAVFVQREVRHFPIEIGPSTVQESVWMPELVEQAMRLLEGLQWYGVVEVEFMRDPRDGVPKLMEINPRFWNSLAMAVQAGVDFPHLLYQIAVQGDCDEVREYAVGRFCRNLWPSDWLHFLGNRERRAMSPPFAGRGARMQDDIWSRDDPLALLGFLLGSARLMGDRNVWKMMFRR